MSSTDSASVATNYSQAPASMPRNVYKSLRRDIRAITASEKMTEFIFENEEELNELPTRLLNTWHKVDGWTFRRRSGVLHFERLEKKAVKTLQDQVAELRAVIATLIKVNGLRLPEDVGVEA
jgi:hypothetical protein